MKEFSLKARFARRFPDPVYPGAERHVMFVSVTEIPDEIPLDPNPREQKIDRAIWKEIRSHLLNETGVPNSFHLKNKGITIIADRVKKTGEDSYDLFLGDSQGIVDGGHTYRLLRDCMETVCQHNDEEDSLIDQYVKVEILTGLDPTFVVEVAGGLNTAVQVQKMSLHNLDSGFDWLKQELSDEPYFDQIAFRENENKPYDARDIVAILELFNVTAFPDGQISHPLRAYTAKATVLDNFIENPDEYLALRPILRDVLELHDTVRKDAMKLYNALGEKRAGKLVFVETRKRGKYQLPFLTQADGEVPQTDSRLSVAALFPMLAAFRSIVRTKDGKAEWKVGGLPEALSLWERIGGNLMVATQDTNEDVGRKANAIGRNKNHWRTLYGIVETTYLRNAAN